MSLTQTYYVASTARSKLGREANRADHNLRLLVGHANLLDSLMLDLADQEREQEAWFNDSVKKASKQEQPQHITWVDAIPEEDDDDYSDDGSDDGSEIYDKDADEMFNIPLRKMRSPPVTVSSAEISEEDMEYDEMDEEDDDEHALTRVQSVHSPPELCDSDSDDEDESMPTSPDAQATFELDDKEREAVSTTGFYDSSKSQQHLEDYIMQQAHKPQQPLIAAY